MPALLLALREEGFTGSVVISSAPGGTIHLEHGLVTAIETPGAPTAETLLLKSRRVSEHDWAAAEAAARSADHAAGRPADLGAALVAQASIGAAELETVCAAAVFDGAFALVLSPPGSWETHAATPPAGLALRPGVEPQRLFAETARRTALLTRLWGPPGELARRRITPATTSVATSPGIPLRQREVLAAATGRRTARDIAFALGRGVFAVLLDLVRLDARRLLHRPAAPAATAPSVARRTPPSEPQAGRPGADPLPLPRRVPGGRNPASHHRSAVSTTPAEGASAPFGSPAVPHRARATDTTEKSTP
ncbi:hypothetical protein ACIRBX_02980 [Kitasatospora sp. NPDC096147]|uniref:hypothetical protein n=1 Tax=Kitasatospora sp. NPDC096147 TaxID=3364093 RepID=UPI00382A1692